MLRQVNGFVAAGGKELVFSGINLGRWGRDLPDQNSAAPHNLAALLASLVRQIFEQTELPRLRLSSIEPMDWDAGVDRLMAEFGGKRLARHAHLPLQSGSDAVLRRMHRRYRPWHYAEKVAALMRAAGPELTLGADVMVGFPGETDAEFEETLEFVRSLPFGYLHLFPFSPRPGTRAWALHTEHPVPQASGRRAHGAHARTCRRKDRRTSTADSLVSELDAITLHTPETLVRAGPDRRSDGEFLPVEVEGAISRPIGLSACERDWR